VKYKTLFSPHKMGELTIKNRIVLPAMGTNLAEPDGLVSDRNVNYYSSRAKGGTGLVIVEAMFIHRTAKHRHNGMGISEDRFLPGLTRLAKAIKDGGATAAVQIVHNGRLMSSKSSGCQTLAPSAIRHRANGEMPKEMDQADIDEIVESFAKAAARAEKAGFDAVEVHGAHGYLIQQFMSPVTNLRQDKYGGSFENRIRFALEVVRAIKREVKHEFPIIYRLSFTEFLPNGIPEEEMLKFAKILEEEGIAAIHVSAGLNETPEDMAKAISPMYYGPGHLAGFAGQVKEKVSIPVIAVGRINTPELAEEILSSGKADFVAMGRALIADPMLPLKAMQGRTDEIRPCISCNAGCIDRLGKQLSVKCVQNPFVGEADEDYFTPAGVVKRIAVLGGGPAGLEVARIAAKRGHKVTVFEKNEVGSQIKIASCPPQKAGLMDVITWRKNLLLKQGVAIVCGEPPTTFNTDEWDLVVLAVGAIPKTIPISAPGGAKVVGASEILTAVPQEKSYLILGGGMVGLETADYLADFNKQVYVVEMLPDVGREVVATLKPFLLKRLKESGVMIYTSTKFVSWDQEGVHLIGPNGENIIILSIDCLVVAVGYQPNMPKIEGTTPVVKIGDCESTGTILDAILNAAQLATEI